MTGCVKGISNILNFCIISLTGTDETWLRAHMFALCIPGLWNVLAALRATGINSGFTPNIEDP